MTKDQITAWAREAGGLPDPMVFIGAYERFAALVAAHVRETEFKPDWNKYQQGLADGAAAEREAFPDLTAVINWLENGCDPKEAAKELRLYAAAISARRKA